jgi:predicted DNA-binding ribbon-helix-helix protein
MFFWIFKETNKKKLFWRPIKRNGGVWVIILEGKKWDRTNKLSKERNIKVKTLLILIDR